MILNLMNFRLFSEWSDFNSMRLRNWSQIRPDSSLAFLAAFLCTLLNLNGFSFSRNCSGEDRFSSVGSSSFRSWLIQIIFLDIYSLEPSVLKELTAYFRIRLGVTPKILNVGGLACVWIRSFFLRMRDPKQFCQIDLDANDYSPSLPLDIEKLQCIRPLQYNA